METSETRGTAAPGPDLSDEPVRAAPVLGSVDDLLIEDLTDEEDDAFAAALQRGAGDGTDGGAARSAARGARRHR
jgi:hypothetical protein